MSLSVCADGCSADDGGAEVDAGTDAGLSFLYGIAVDADAGEIFVVNNANDSVSVFSRSMNGDTPP